MGSILRVGVDCCERLPHPSLSRNGQGPARRRSRVTPTAEVPQLNQSHPLRGCGSSQTCHSDRFGRTVPCGNGAYSKLFSQNIQSIAIFFNWNDFLVILVISFTGIAILFNYVAVIELESLSCRCLSPPAPLKLLSGPLGQLVPAGKCPSADEPLPTTVDQSMLMEQLFVSVLCLTVLQARFVHHRVDVLPVDVLLSILP